MKCPKWVSQHILGLLDISGVLALAGIPGPVVLVAADLVASHF